jgi:hypothetical protein
MTHVSVFIIGLLKMISIQVIASGMDSGGLLFTFPFA